MNCKSILFVLLLLIFSVSAVSAADFNNVTELSGDADDSLVVDDSNDFNFQLLGSDGSSGESITQGSGSFSDSNQFDSPSQGLCGLSGGSSSGTIKTGSGSSEGNKQ